MLSLQFEFLERRERGLVRYAKGRRGSPESFLLLPSQVIGKFAVSGEPLPVQSSFTPLPYRLECLLQNYKDSES